MPATIAAPSRKWDNRGYATWREYDAARRPLRTWTGLGNTATYLVERTIWGEGVTNDTTINVRGRVYQQLDHAGLLTNEQYDFKGNLLSWNRRVLVDYSGNLDYSAAATLPTPPVLPSNIDALFPAEAFQTQETYDALNRVTSKTTPDGSITTTTYNEAGLIETVSVQLAGRHLP